VFVLPVWFIRSDVVETGYLLTIFVFVQATGVVILPINELVMVTSAAHIGDGNEASLERTASTMFKLVTVLSAAIVAVVYPFREVLFRLGIGSKQVLVGASAYAALLGCIIPMTIFAGLKGVIDMRWRRPRNLFNLALAQTLGVASFYALRGQGWSPKTAVLTSSLVTMWSLGALTVLAVRGLLKRIDWKEMGAALAVVIAGATASTACSRILESSGVGWTLHALAAAVIGLTCILATARAADREVWNLGVDQARRFLAAVSRRGAHEQG
jgi:Na+-driven multidrug efflux pump